MPATSRYQINYEVDNTQYPVDTLLLKYKVNRVPGNTYTLAASTASPLPNTSYVFDTDTVLPTVFYSHEVYDFIIESDCPNGLTEFGDRFYVFNPICTPFTLTSVAPNTVTVDWTCYINPSVVNPNITSLKQYILEYRNLTSGGPWTAVTFPAALVISTLGFPNFTTTVSTGIISANTYEFKLTTVLTYNLEAVGGGTIPTDIVIDVCPTLTILAS